MTPRGLRSLPESHGINSLLCPSFLVTLTSVLSELGQRALSKARGGQGQRERHPQTGALGTCQRLCLAGSSTTCFLTLSG